MKTMIDTEELLSLNDTLNQAITVASLLRRGWDLINWEADADKGGLTATIPLFQKEAIDRLFVDLLGNSGS